MSKDVDVVFDPDGDLILLVGTALKRHRVCSKTLSRSSPVFKKMLYGSFVESKPTDEAEWIVKLPEDNTAAMAVFLSIIHGTFYATPKTLPLAKLYTLLTLTEKYDATAFLRPWAPGWIDAVKAQTGDPWLLGIAWELGHINLFHNMMATMAENSTISTKDGTTLLYGSEMPFWKADGTLSKRLCTSVPTWPIKMMQALAPTEMLESITGNRMKLLTAELQPFLNLYDNVVDGRCRGLGPYPYAGLQGGQGQGAWDCDCMVLGSLVKSFLKCNIGGLKLSVRFCGSYKGSVADLRQTLNDVKVSSPHPQCCDEINKKLNEGRKAAVAARNTMAFIRPKQLKYLNKQAEKMGFPVRK